MHEPELYARFSSFQNDEDFVIGHRSALYDCTVYFLHCLVELCCLLFHLWYLNNIDIKAIRTMIILGLPKSWAFNSEPLKMISKILPFLDLVMLSMSSSPTNWLLFFKTWPIFISSKLSLLIPYTPVFRFFSFETNPQEVIFFRSISFSDIVNFCFKLSLLKINPWNLFTAEGLKTI